MFSTQRNVCVWGHRSANYPNLVIIHHINVLKTNSTNNYVQLCQLEMNTYLK